MATPIKKISAFFLLLILAAPLGYIFIFRYKQENISHRMKELLEKEIQHDIVMAEEALYWIKPGKEILAGDKMFDVKRISRLGNGLVKVTGLFDEEETSLVKQFTEKQQQNNSKENRKIAQLIQVMQAIFDHAASKDFTSIPIASMHYQFNDNSIFPAITTILTPPPRS